MNIREITSKTASIPYECTLQLRLSLLWGRGKKLKILETKTRRGHFEAGSIIWNNRKDKKESVRK